MSTEKRKSQKRAAQKRYRTRHLEHCRAVEQAWHAKHYGKYRRLIWDNHLKHRYSFTREGYDSLLKSQQGRCAICLKMTSPRGLGVDHDHQTGRVRGLLCDGCNTKLAALENYRWRINAEKYLGGSK